MLPVVVGLCASGLVRLQSGMKLPLRAVHERLVGGGKMPPPPPGIRTAGFAVYARLLTLAPCRYLPRLTLSAVLPVPNTSNAAAMRGVMSLYPVAPSRRPTLAPGKKRERGSVRGGNQ